MTTVKMLWLSSNNAVQCKDSISHIKLCCFIMQNMYIVTTTNYYSTASLQLLN